MRQNFALASADAILNIKAFLLEDMALFREFQGMLSPKLLSHGCSEVLWQLVIERMSTLFGTELANQMMDELASQKRKTSAPKRADKFAKPATSEQLRFAKMQKKIRRHFEVEDLTLDQELMDLTEDNGLAAPAPAPSPKAPPAPTPNPAPAPQAPPAPAPKSPPLFELPPEPVPSEAKPDHALGAQVTAIEGTGSATRLYTGVVVEIDMEENVYIICCRGVSNYPNGYNMKIPFTESRFRINQPVHTGKRKRKTKRNTDYKY